MSKGNIIPELHLSTLQKFIERSTTPPSMVLSNMFPVNNAPSDTIEWESRYGSAEMIPFVARGSRGPSFGDDGVGKHSMKAAYFASDRFFGEEFLNNLRKPGTRQEKMSGQSEIARAMSRMLNSVDRRREYMFSKMLFDGSMSYTIKGSSAAPTFASVSWGIPTSHQVTLGSTSYWYGTSAETADRDVFADIFAMKNRLADSLEMEVTSLNMFLNSRLLQSLVKDSGIRDLVQTQNISEAQLVNNPAGTIAQILGVGSITPYDASYTITSPLAQAYTSGTTIYVTSPEDFVVGADVWIKNSVDGAAGPRATITAVNMATGAITLSAALTGVTGVPFKSQLAMRQFFLSPKKIVAVVPNVDGMPIAEMMQAPHGNEGIYGKRMRTKMEEYPDGQRLIMEDLCLPVCYFPSAVYQLTVHED
jgi:hypothetical protein